MSTNPHRVLLALLLCLTGISTPCSSESPPIVVPKGLKADIYFLKSFQQDKREIVKFSLPNGAYQSVRKLNPIDGVRLSLREGIMDGRYFVTVFPDMSINGTPGYSEYCIFDSDSNGIYFLDLKTNEEKCFRVEGNACGGSVIYDGKIYILVRKYSRISEKDAQGKEAVHFLKSSDSSLFEVNLKTGSSKEVDISPGLDPSIDRNSREENISGLSFQNGSLYFNYFGTYEHDGQYKMNLETGRIEKLKFPEINLLKDGRALFFDPIAPPPQLYAVSRSSDPNECFDPIGGVERYSGKRQTLLRLRSTQKEWYDALGVFGQSHYFLYQSNTMLNREKEIIKRRLFLFDPNTRKTYMLREETTHGIERHIFLGACFEP